MGEMECMLAAIFGDSLTEMGGGLSGWVAAVSGIGLLGPILYWLTYVHLPAKDVQLAAKDASLKKWIDEKDAQLTMLIKDKDTQLERKDQQIEKVIAIKGEQVKEMLASQGQQLKDLLTAHSSQVERMHAENKSQLERVIKHCQDEVSHSSREFGATFEKLTAAIKDRTARRKQKPTQPPQPPT